MRKILRSALAFSLAFGVSFMAREAVAFEPDLHGHPGWTLERANIVLFAFIVVLPAFLGLALASHLAVLAVLRRRVTSRSMRAVVGRAAATGLLTPVGVLGLSTLSAPRNEAHGTLLVAALLTAVGAVWPRERRGAM